MHAHITDSASPYFTLGAVMFVDDPGQAAFSIEQQTVDDCSKPCRIAWRWRALAAAQTACQRARTPLKVPESSDRCPAMRTLPFKSCSMSWADRACDLMDHRDAA